MLIDADSHHAELYRRESDRWGIQLVRGAEASLLLTTVDLRISMSELYEGIAAPTATVGSCPPSHAQISILPDARPRRHPARDNPARGDLLRRSLLHAGAA